MIGTERSFIDLEGTAHQRLRFAQAGCGLQQLGKVVEPDGNFCMIETEGGFIDLEGAAHQRLRFAEFSLLHYSKCETVYAVSTLRMIREDRSVSANCILEFCISQQHTFH